MRDWRYQNEPDKGMCIAEEEEERVRENEGKLP
jgi:hypothetical protein